MKSTFATTQQESTQATTNTINDITMLAVSVTTFDQNPEASVPAKLIPSWSISVDKGQQFSNKIKYV